MRAAVILIGLLIGGWLTFDGTRALTKGNYVTSASGELGPWSKVVSALGLDPRGAPMKWLHLLLGLAWLTGLIFFGLKTGLGRPVLIACAVGTVWYLPLGTVLSIAELILLLLPALRGPG